MIEKVARIPAKSGFEDDDHAFDDWLFRKQVKEKVSRLDFTIVSSNCLGGKIYQLLNIPYNTPFVGLFLYAPCYIQLLQSLEENLKKELHFEEKSKYRIANAMRIADGKFYPIGLLGDIEIHFRHQSYHTQEACREKWTDRVRRMNFDHLFFLFTDRDLCTEELIEAFDNLPFERKACFTAKAYPHYSSCVHVKEYQNESHVDDLYDHFPVLTQSFDFASWLSGGSGRK